MGWNNGYTIIENTVIACYDRGVLDADLLDRIMEPFIGTDCDHGGCEDLVSKDGLLADMIICKIKRPEEYKNAMDAPEWHEGETPGEKDARGDLVDNDYGGWRHNKKAGDLFSEIWNGEYRMW